MENPRPEEENIIKDIRNLFRLKRELHYTAIKDIRNFFRGEKETKTIKDIILRDIKNFLRHEEEEENYYKPARVSNIWSKNYIEYKSNGDRNKTLSVEEYLNKIRPCLKDTINNLKKFDTENSVNNRNNFILSIDNDEEHVDSLKNRYQNKLESMKGSEFAFGYVHLLYYIYHKINPNRDGSYVDTPQKRK